MKRRIILLLLVLAAAFSLYTPPPARAARYADTDAHWASAMIDTWSGYGVIQGSGGRFYPDSSITRGDLAIIISRAMNLTQTSAAEFHDLNGVTAEQKAAVLKLHAAGIMQGSGGYMRPGAPISREEAAVMMGRMMRLDGSGGTAAYFSDSYAISSWAADIVRAMRSRGYISGRSGNRFDPKANITRAEIVKIFDNMFKGYYNRSGTYTASTLGSAVVNTGGVVLKQLTITGDLFITEGAANGKVTLSDVIVNGNVYVMGGSLSLEGLTSLNTVFHEKTTGNAVKYSAPPPARIGHLSVRENTVAVEADGFIRAATLGCVNQSVKLTNAVIGTMTLNAPGITLTTDGNTSIAAGIAVQKFHQAGQGIFGRLTVRAAAGGSSLERQPRDTVVPAGTTIFMAGRTFTNTSAREITYSSPEDRQPPLLSDSQLSAGNLSTTRATISWTGAADNDTAQKDLRYALYFSKSPYMSTVSDIESYGMMATAFTANLLKTDISRLENGELYYFNVIVKDRAENKTCYARYSLRIGKDTTPPYIDYYSISFSEIKETQATVNWRAASDNVTPSGKLKYAVYRSEIASLTSVAACEASGKPIMSAKENVTSYTATGLVTGKPYYFNIVVEDAAGNKACYGQKSVIPRKDVTPPTVAAADIAASDVTKTGAMISWPAAWDDATAAANLRYSLYVSKLPNLDTLGAIEGSGIKPVLDRAAGTTSYRITVPESDNAPRYLNVVVEDEAGNKTCYEQRSVTFGEDTIPPTVPDKAISPVSWTGSSVSLKWAAANDDSGTEQARLQYALYRIDITSNPGVTEESFDTVAEVEAFSGAWRLDLAQNRLAYNVTGLTAGRTYLFNVIVRDLAGNKSAYAPVRVTIDNTPPTVSYKTLTAEPEDVSGSIGFSWAVASDGTTPQSALEYALYASMGTKYTTIADIESKAAVKMPYSANTLSFSVPGILYSTQYHFYVIVKDAMGNKTAYDTYSYIRLDTEAPELPVSKTLTALHYQDGETDKYVVQLSWGPAGDNVTQPENLTYSLYYSAQALTLPTPQGVLDAKLPAVILNARGAASGVHPGRNPGTTCYYYLIVRDEAGNMSLYAPCEVTLPID